MTIRPNHSKPDGSGSEKMDEAAADDVECEMDDAIKPKAVKREYAPSRSEMEEHLISHYPFKAWCEHCERQSQGKGSHEDESR